jgi:hypothetical protein
MSCLAHAAKYISIPVGACRPRGYGVSGQSRGFVFGDAFVLGRQVDLYQFGESINGYAILKREVKYE